MPSNHLILCHPLLLLPSIFPSIRVFSNASALHIGWLKYWNFSLEYSGLISFRTDWFDLLAVQGTHKSLLQHHNLKASILQHSAFFMVQFSWVSRHGLTSSILEFFYTILERICLPMQKTQEMWVLSLGQEDPLAKEMTTHSSTLSWKTPWTEETGGLQSMRSQEVGLDWAQQGTQENGDTPKLVYVQTSHV